MVQAYLVAAGQAPPTDHRGRRDALDDRPELRSAKAPYKVLKEASEVVRYEPRVQVGTAEWTATAAALAKLAAIVRPKLDSKLAQTK